MSQSCAGCQLPILDKFLMHVLDKSWHSACVQCQDCSTPLSDKCFSRDSKLYCRDDFYRRFGMKCGGCLSGISPDNLVMSARNKVFHLECFTCIMCRKQLSTGEQLYVVDDNRFLCKDDFIASGYNGSEDDVDLEQHILDRLDDTLSEEKAALCSGKLSPLGGSLPDDDSRTSTPHLGLHMGYNCGPLLAPPLLDGSSPCSSSTKTSPVAGMLPELSSCNNLGMNASIKGELDQISASQNGILMNGLSDQCGVDASDLELDLDDPKDIDGKDGGAGAKRRGPRTTIKAKQLETLKSAFSATPKPTRHIREQLAQETGLNMRVIQVWFQNRRSKERRMKQLSALGARRHFFRNPRRMRAMGREDMVQDPSLPPEMMQGPPGTFNYFDNEFYGNAYPGSFPGPMPGHDFYAGPLCPPGGAPPVLHPVSGISSQGHSAAFMSSPPGALSAVATGNRMSAILPTSGAASLTTPSQLAPPLGLPPPGHPHPPMTPVDVLPPTPGQLTPDAILSLTGGEPLPPMTSNDASPPSNGSCAALPTSLASTMAPGNPISCGPTSGQPLLGHQLLVQPQLQMTGHSQLGAAVVNGFPGEMAVGDGSW